MPVTATSDSSFAADVLEAEGAVLVDFTAAWCAPCRIMEPVLDGLAAERPDLRVVRLDVDADQATAARYGVLAMPTLMLFRDGAPVLRLVGARPRRRLVAELEAVL